MPRGISFPFQESDGWGSCLWVLFWEEESAMEMIDTCGWAAWCCVLYININQGTLESSYFKICPGIAFSFT